MIEINLVPVNLRQKERSGAGIWTSIDLPKEILLGVGSMVIILLVLIHLSLIGMYVAKLTQQLMYKGTWQKMLPDKNNVDSISQELRDLRTKTATINDITSKKAIVWSQKLNILSDIAPKGVWFKKILWDNSLLVLEGSAFSKLHDEITIVGNFVSTLKKDEGFAKDFSSIELNSIGRSKKGMMEVADFKITAKVK